DPDKMKLVQVNFPMIDQLEAGNVDAIPATAPDWNMAEGNPDLRIGPDMCVDAVIEATNGETTESPTGVVLSNTKCAEENSDTLEKWRSALVKAADWINANDAEARKLMAEKTDTDQDIADITQ